MTDQRLLEAAARWLRSVDDEVAAQMDEADLALAASEFIDGSGWHEEVRTC